MMFTGIVEELGTVAAVEVLPDAQRLTVYGPLVCADARPGDSIAVNGCCLTVVGDATDVFRADVMQETLGRPHRARPCRCHWGAGQSRVQSTLGDSEDLHP